MDEHFTIRLTVADKEYALRIKRSEEEAHRIAAKEINNKLSLYRGRGDARTTDVDYMAMTAIQAVTDKAKIELRAQLYEQELEKLSDKLNNYLTKNVR